MLIQRPNIDMEYTMISLGSINFSLNMMSTKRRGRRSLYCKGLFAWFKALSTIEGYALCTSYIVFTTIFESFAS